MMLSIGKTCASSSTVPVYRFVNYDQIAPKLHMHCSRILGKDGKKVNLLVFFFFLNKNYLITHIQELLSIWLIKFL
jgi:hypothetical protein